MGGSCSQGCKREFGCSSRNWGCSHDDPVLFGTSQWKCGPPVLFLLLHRLPWALLWLSYLVYDITTRVFDPMYFTFMTKWQLIILVLNALVGLLVTCIIQTGHMRTKWNPLLGFYSVLWNISTAFAPAITLIYWAMIYDPATSNADFITIVTHVVNTAYTLLDVMVVAIPLRAYHFYHSAVVAGIYVIFAAVYNMTTGRLIYPLFNFREKPASAAAFGIGGIAIGTAMWFVMFGLYHLRVLLAAKCIRGRNKLGDGQKEAERTDPEFDKTETETTEY
ncbi:protein rolling stone-like [Lineus longissimus]|uniref:protein rolling stone-like n=1 Tax=Lineus longissimus TaxID=88925 RepID=UPI002B4FAD94